MSSNRTNWPAGSVVILEQDYKNAGWLVQLTHVAPGDVRGVYLYDLKTKVHETSLRNCLDPTLFNIELYQAHSYSLITKLKDAPNVNTETGGFIVGKHFGEAPEDLLTIQYKSWEKLNLTRRKGVDNG